ncbi:MAG: TIGR00303 family protein [Chloroflexota bacterium]|nr:TIGR00303 family protein [Chloroflexota bacterium]
MSEPARTLGRVADLPILLAHAPTRGAALVDRLRGRPLRFVCVVAHTETAEIDGISAAGVTPELRRLTAAADAEALFHGRPRCMEGVPSNPLGAPGPVIITLAGLRLSGAPFGVFGLGLRVRPDAPVTVVDRRWGRSIVTGDAVPHAAELFERGYEHGRQLGEASRGAYLVVAESVPGGTTTALALLCGLGFDARGKVSGSMPGNAHALKNRVVRQALAAAGLLDGPRRTMDARPAFEPLRVAAAVGDPMQPFVAGLVLAAHRRVPVLLAGGSQMAAVLALMFEHARLHTVEVVRDNLAIATTSWVVRDPAADLGGLVAEIDGTGAAEAAAGIPVLAGDVDLGASRHPPLRRYEQFLAKEGVGAGAALVAAALSTGVSREALVAAIEQVYDEIYRDGIGARADPNPVAPDTITR